ELERLANQYQVGVVGDVAARRAQVNDPAGGRAAVAVCVDVRHHVVPQLALVLRRPGEIDVVDGRAQLGDLFDRDVEPQLALGLGQRDPQLPPGGMNRLRRPETDQLFGRITAEKGVLVLVVAQKVSSGYITRARFGRLTRSQRRRGRTASATG